jgi:UDP-N-acetylglucosamine/UDP-N-acetylgalactosamine diphosphorylase
MTENISSERQRFNGAGQEQVFRFWEELDPEAKKRLAADASEIDLAEIDHLVKTLVGGAGGEKLDLEGLEPAPYVEHPRMGGDLDTWQEAVAIGEQALRNGKVAAFTVAGGQGTRLGYDGPKGTFPVGPVSGKSASFRSLRRSCLRRDGDTASRFPGSS